MDTWVGMKVKLQYDHTTSAGPCSTACWLQTPPSDIWHLGEEPSEHISPDWDHFWQLYSMSGYKDSPNLFGICLEISAEGCFDSQSRHMLSVQL